RARSLLLAARLRSADLRPRAGGRVRGPRPEAPHGALARHLFRGRARVDPRGLRHAAAPDRAALPAVDPPATERRPGRVGARAVRDRSADCDPRPAVPDTSRGCAAPLGGNVFRMARPSRLRRGAPAPGVAAAPRAPLVLRDGLPLLVARA